MCWCLCESILVFLDVVCVLFFFFCFEREKRIALGHILFLKDVPFFFYLPQCPQPPSKSLAELGTMWLCLVTMTPGVAAARVSAGDEGRCPCPNAPTPSCPPRTAWWATDRAPGTSCKGSCWMETCLWPSCMLSGKMPALMAAGWRSQDGSMTTKSTYAWEWKKVKKEEKKPHFISDCLKRSKHMAFKCVFWMQSMLENLQPKTGDPQTLCHKVNNTKGMSIYCT